MGGYVLRLGRTLLSIENCDCGSNITINYSSSGLSCVATLISNIAATGYYWPPRTGGIHA